MSQVFALHDLADVLAAFPPARPTSQQPSIIWNSANETLIQSGVVFERFEKLFSKQSRIELARLPAELGIKDIDWILASPPRVLLYSSERKAIFGKDESERFVDHLRNVAKEQYLYLKTFATENDIDLDSLKQRLEREEGIHVVEDPASKSHRTWTYATTIHNSTRDRVEALLREAGNEHKVDLSAELTGVPRFVIQQLAEDVSRDKNLPGTVRSGKTRITFLSEAYETRVKEERAKKIARQFSNILVETHRNGYHRIPEDSEETPGLQKVFYERTKAGVDDGSFSLIIAKDTPIALAFTNRLEAVLDDLKTAAQASLETGWRSTGVEAPNTALDQARMQLLIDSSSSQEFAKLILEDERHQKAIADGLRAKLDELESESLQHCTEAFITHVRTPVKLYLTGLSNVKEPVLRQRLDEFVLEFLRKDLIPGGVQVAQDEKQQNSSWNKELDRFGSTCTDAKTLADIQTTLTKFAKKQKLRNTSEAQEKVIRKEVLQQKVKSLKKMIRASDILQNLIWILLAQELDGVFISSGRDTTRMIKFYQGVGDAEKAERLLAWKDKFKDAQETREDIEGMRLMAEQIVEQMVVTTNGVHTENGH